jgi:hypothetical protein
VHVPSGIGETCTIAGHGHRRHSAVTQGADASIRAINAPMVKQVEPTIASLIGEKPYDEKTTLGFNCFRCHTKI